MSMILIANDWIYVCLPLAKLSPDTLLRRAASTPGHVKPKRVDGVATTFNWSVTVKTKRNRDAGRTTGRRIKP